MKVGRADERVRLLRAWSAANGGRVPRVSEVQELLKIGRSMAAQAMLEAFGPDVRDGYTRKITRRKVAMA